VISYQLRQRKYLLQISRAMTSRLDLPSLLRLILNSAADLVRAEAGLIGLRRGQVATLTIQASYGLPTSLLPRFGPLLADLPLQTDGYAIPDLQGRLNLVAHAVRLPLSQIVALPLIFQERLLGVIYLFRSGSIAFSARRRSEVPIGCSRRQLATWPRACTPASVRPAPTTRTSQPSTRLRASSRRDWTALPRAWRCHPTKAVPS
jgi:hypothetical protein